MTAPATENAGPLASEIAQFLAYKRTLGRRYLTEASELRLFDRYLAARGVTSIDAITPREIETFLGSRPRILPRSYNQLVGVLRRFFRWLVSRGLAASSPVLCPLRRAGSPRTPFILAPNQAKRLLELAAALPDAPGIALRGPTYHAIFAIMYGLGLRVGEVCRLGFDDIDGARQLLVIRDTKFGKDRLVPFGPRIGAMLARFLCARRAGRRGARAGEPLFGGREGGRLGRAQIGRVFRGLLPALGFAVPPGTSRPHLHSLRHSFAVGTLLRWYRAGINPAQRVLQLSTFLGHVQPESTAVYLTITADLLDEAGPRFEALALPLVTGSRQ